jgi:hypothetical protein
MSFALLFLNIQFEKYHKIMPYLTMYQINSGGCCVRDHMVGGFTTSLPMQSVPITTDV